MDYFNDAEQVALVRRLRTLNDSGKLSWKVRGESTHDFITYLGDTAFVVRSVDKDDAFPFAVSVFRRNSDEKSKFSLLQRVSTDDARTELNELIPDLYWDVKRGVLGVEEVVASVFADLDRADDS